MFLDTSGLYSFSLTKKTSAIQMPFLELGGQFLYNPQLRIGRIYPLCLSRGLNRVKTLEFAEAISKNELIEIILDK
jgi:hypothetical protein